MIWYLFMFILSNAVQVDGGLITALYLVGNASSEQWIGLLGKVEYGSFTYPSFYLFNHSGVYWANLRLGVSCPTFRQSYILFSNHSTLYYPLRAGNLSLLEQLVNGTDGAYNTFLSNTTLSLPIGVLRNVPYLVTPATPYPVPTYYLQDRRGNLVFLSPVFTFQAYNGQAVNFQVMLPLLNRSPTKYYPHALVECDYVEPSYSGGGSYSPLPAPKEETVPPSLPVCSYYVKECALKNGILECEMEGCGSKDILQLPYTTFLNTVEIRPYLLPTLERKLYVQELYYDLPGILILLTGGFLLGLFIVRRK
ncbi:MAG: hypothetical protein GXN92_00175 [Candidatus Micrarchaeota archaeon]|nr:hypothetical protein [Candidatus Micrarchaeota archaeon]